MTIHVNSDAENNTPDPQKIVVDKNEEAIAARSAKKMVAGSTIFAFKTPIGTSDSGDQIIGLL